MTHTDSEQSRRDELATFLRDRRSKLRPESVGLRVARRRRAQGLLREEVAETAGVSVTWYTWLEQGRPTNPSARTLEGLATALRLDATERAYLFRLARPDLNPNLTTEAGSTLSEELIALLNGLAPHPVYVLNGRWDVLAWNASADVVFGGFAHLQGNERNVLHRLLFDPAWRALFIEIDAIIDSAIAQFRATTLAEYGVAQFVDALLEQSPRFKEVWEQRELALPLPRRKILDHPRGGRLEFHYATLRPDGAPRDVRFAIYTPADADTAARIRRLLE